MKMIWLAATGLAMMISADAGEVRFEDTFDGPLKDSWQWIREDKSDWQLKDGGLEVRSQPGRIWGGNDAENLLLRPFSSRPRQAASIDVAHRPAEKWEQAGLLWYVDDDNFVKLISEQIDGKMYVVTARELAGRGSVVGKIEVPTANLRLRLLVEGDRVTGQWRVHPDDAWSTSGVCDFAAERPRFGLFTQNGSATVNRTVRFDNFAIE